MLAGVWCFAAIPIEEINSSAARAVSTAFGLFNIPVAANIFTGVLLSVVGSALMVHKRAALWFAALVFEVGWLAVAALVTALRASGDDRAPKVLLDTRFEVARFAIEVVMAVVLLVLLWRIRGLFQARVAPGSLRRAVANIAVGLGASAGVGVLLTEVFPNTLHGQRRVVMWALRTALGLMPDRDSPFYGGTGPRWVAAVIGALSTAALVRGGQVLFRSARATRHLEPDDELHIRRLLLEHGEQDSLGYFATRRDKAVVCSADRRAAITYRVEAGASLASGDPIGDPASWPAAVEAWISQAREYGWSPAALSASEAGAAVYRRAGLRVFALGDEAIIDVADFHINGPPLRSVRQAVARVRRAGYRVEVRRHGDIAPAEMAELAACAGGWRDGTPERGFSMSLGRLGDEADHRCVMVTARDARGRVRALLSFVPWGRGGVSLDVMRRDPEADNGVVEFMVCALVDAARGLGVRRISLNFAMFREVFSASERIGAGPVVRITASLLGVASRWWQLEGLYRSNVKYQPRWQARFICFADSLQLNRAMIAAAIAEGFLPRPRLRAAQLEQRPATPAFGDAVRAQERDPAVDRVTWIAGRSARVRHHKLEVLAASGMAAYPPTVARSEAIAAVRGRHRGLPAGSATGEHVSVVGRVASIRQHGRLCFAVLREAGVDLQVMLSLHRAGASELESWRRTVDVGDHVSCSGEVVSTRSGELSIDVVTWSMASKCLRPLPNRRSGALSPEVRVRDRHLDLIGNPQAMAMLRHRSALLASLRLELHAKGFMEVETPMLHAVHGGATARPFTTHINAYNQELFLRIAPELFLKRLCVGGVDRLFELNRNFRNEGADASHNPEFTALELYQAHADYVDMRAMAHHLVVAAATAIHGCAVAKRIEPDGRVVEVDLEGEWPVVGVHDAVSRAIGCRLDPGSPVELVRSACSAHGVVAPFDATAGELVHDLYEALVEPCTEMPTFYTDFPIEVSPLARAHRDDPRLAERWDLVAFGTELGTAYSELTDPIDQRARLVRQSQRAAAGDPEAMSIDEDFLAALECAMPPTGGLGLGVDRLLMLLTGASIRSTLAFPFVRPLASARGVAPDAD